jgi:hypothetical protein
MIENGHVQEGLNWTSEILRAPPRHGPTHRLLADYYQKQGKPGQANYHRLMATTEPDGGTSTAGLEIEYVDDRCRQIPQADCLGNDSCD